MADWDDIINNWIMMGSARMLAYAINVERRRREGEDDEERRPGIMPPAGRGIRPVVPRVGHWEGFQEENFYLSNTVRGRSRPFPAPQPFLQIHHRHQPHSLPHCLTGGFGYVAPNVHLHWNKQPSTPGPKSTAVCSIPSPSSRSGIRS